MSKDDWKDNIILISEILVPVCFVFIFIFIVKYKESEIENEFLREKIEEQKVIIEKMEK